MGEWGKRRRGNEEKRRRGEEENMKDTTKAFQAEPEETEQDNDLNCRFFCLYSGCYTCTLDRLLLNPNLYWQSERQRQCR